MDSLHALARGNVWLLLLAFAASIAAYPWLPDPMPSWSLTGGMDGSIERPLGAFMLPFFAALVYVLMLVLPRVDPADTDSEGFRVAYRGFALTLVAFMLGVHAFALVWALGYNPPFSLVTSAALGALFFAAAALLRRAEPTWRVGIRTPWTLSSRDTWRATHALGARLSTGLGVAALGTIPLGASWTLVVALGGALVLALACTAFSYRHFRRSARGAVAG